MDFFGFFVFFLVEEEEVVFELEVCEDVEVVDDSLGEGIVGFEMS